MCDRSADERFTAPWLAGRGVTYSYEEDDGRLRLRLMAAGEVARDASPPPDMPPLRVMLLDAFTMDTRGGETLDTARACGERPPHGLALVGEARLVKAARELVTEGLVHVAEIRRDDDGQWQSVERGQPSTDDENLLRYWYRPTERGHAVLRAHEQALDRYYDTNLDGGG